MIRQRILTLKRTDVAGDAVVYVMSRDQRICDNHALLEAQSEALEYKLPLIVLFVLYPSSAVRGQEHVSFMIDGLKQLRIEAAQKQISFIIQTGKPVQTILSFLKDVNAKSVYFDFNPLRGPRAIVKIISKKFAGSSYVIDTHNIVPVWAMSDKQEFAAHTIRRKLHKMLEEYLDEPERPQKHPYVSTLTLPSFTQEDLQDYISKIESVGISIKQVSGVKAAQSQLDDFIENGLSDYALLRNDIAVDAQSRLSPYLHYGQISSLRIALAVMDVVDEPPLLLREAKMPQTGNTPSRIDGMNALFEELIVRKELADNFCFYNTSYDSLEGGPDWALKDLKTHETDRRHPQYSLAEMEDALTHDELWNASQRQLRRKGNIHGYMRMYWAKKILEWSSSPSHAVRVAVYLNDRYSIDGKDPNGYVGILWSITGLHDRLWFEREIFGKVRYMSASGIKKKFDTKKYIADNS